MRKRNKNSIVLLICRLGSLTHNKLEGKLGRRTPGQGKVEVAFRSLAFFKHRLSPPTPVHPRQEPGVWAELWEGSYPHLSSHLPLPETQCN